MKAHRWFPLALLPLSLCLLGLDPPPAERIERWRSTDQIRIRHILEIATLVEKYHELSGNYPLHNAKTLPIDVKITANPRSEEDASNLELLLEDLRSVLGEEVTLPFDPDDKVVMGWPREYQYHTAGYNYYVAARFYFPNLWTSRFDPMTYKLDISEADKPSWDVPGYRTVLPEGTAIAELKIPGLRPEGDEADPLFAMADFLGEREEFTEAAKHFKEALSIHRVKERDWDAMFVALRLGFLYADDLDETERGAVFLEEALEIALRTNDLKNIAGISHELSILHERLDNDDRAFELQALAVDTFVAYGNRLREARARSNFGQSLFRKGRYEEAKKEFLTALNINEEQRQDRSLAINHLYLGKIALESDDPASAEKHYEKSRAYWEDYGNRGEAANMSLRIGDIRTDQRDFNGAVEALAQALEIFEELQDPKGYAITLRNIGNAEAARNNIQDARDCYEEALEIFREFEDEKRARSVETLLRGLDRRN